MKKDQGISVNPGEHLGGVGFPTSFLSLLREMRGVESQAWAVKSLLCVRDLEQGKAGGGILVSG